MKFKKQDFILAPLSFIIILVFCVLTTILASRYFLWLGEFKVIGKIVFFYLAFVFWTGVALRIIRKICPLREGNFSLRKDRDMVFWKLQGFLYTFNIGLLMNANLIPINLRGFFYSFLGARIGKSVMIGGKIFEPPLVEIGDFTQLGEDAIVTGHTVEGDRVSLRRVKIGKNVTIGARSFILPGAEIGDGAVVAIGAVVTGKSKISPGEFWGGIPARRIKQ